MLLSKKGKGVYAKRIELTLEFEASSAPSAKGWLPHSHNQL